MQFHPDRNPGDAGAEEKFKECSEAYTVLSDPDKRASYDRFGHAGANGTGGGFGGFDMGTIDFAEIFGDFFGFGDVFGGGGRRRSRAQRGGDLREDLTIEFEEAVFGCEKGQLPPPPSLLRLQGPRTPLRRRPGPLPAMRRPRPDSLPERLPHSVARTCPVAPGMGIVIPDPCQKCKGRARGSADSTAQRRGPGRRGGGYAHGLLRAGDAGVHGGPAGDVYVVLHVKEHAVFEREGKDLHCAVPVSFAQAALGAEIRIPTLEGEHLLKVPEGTQTGTVFRLRGQGLPVVNGRGKGDLLAEVKVQIPAKLNKQQRELLQQVRCYLSRGE